MVNGTRFLVLIFESCVWEERGLSVKQGVGRWKITGAREEAELQHSFTEACVEVLGQPSFPASQHLGSSILLPYLGASPLKCELSSHYMQANDSSNQLMHHYNRDRLYTIMDKNHFSKNRNIMNQITKHVQAHWPSASQQTINILPFIWLILSSAYERYNLVRHNLVLWSNPKGWTGGKQNVLQGFLGEGQHEEAGS